MEILIDPNVAYLLLVVGIVLVIMALFAPGTGVLEIGALFVLFLAGCFGNARWRDCHIFFYAGDVRNFFGRVAFYCRRKFYIYRVF